MVMNKISSSLFNIFCLLTLKPIFAPRLKSLFLNSRPFQQRNALSKRTAAYSPSERAALLRSRVCFVSCCVPRSRLTFNLANLCLLYTEVHRCHISCTFFSKMSHFCNRVNSNSQTGCRPVSNWWHPTLPFPPPDCPLHPNNKNY